MRSIFLSLCVLLPVATASTAFYPSFPENWEEEADPRFEPRIAEVARPLAFFPTERELDEARFAWHSWGPEAIPVVERLRIAPKWRDFRHAFTVLLSICPLEEAEPARESLVVGTLREESGYFQSTPGTHDFLGIFTKYNAPKATVLLRKLANNKNPSLQLLAATWLQRLDDKNLPIVNRIIDTYEQSEDVKLRKRVAGLLLSRATREDCARALKISKTISSEYHATIEAHIVKLQARLRANEPMRIILEEERLADR